MTSRTLIGVAAALLLPVAAQAQPADQPIPAANTAQYPPGITVRQTPAGPVYVDSRGLTLYGLDMRTLTRWGADPAVYCKTRCNDWEPVLAPADTAPNIAFPAGFNRQLRMAIENGIQLGQGAQQRRPGQGAPQASVRPGFFADPQLAPDWTVIAGPAGPQWTYKGWHMVYIRKGDAPGSTALDGADDYSWNTLKFVPPKPKTVAPPMVTSTLHRGAWVLADTKGRVLFTGTCAAACAEWQPLPGGLASRGVGAWTVARNGETPQWHRNGLPVYVTAPDDPGAVPAGATVLLP